MKPENHPRTAALDGEKDSLPGRDHGAWAFAAVFAWGLAVHLVYLAGEFHLGLPISPLFFADGLHFFTRSRLLATGGTALGSTALGSDLPFHPPLVSWLLWPLWPLLGEPAAVAAASKILMAVFNATTLAVIYLLLRRHLPASARPWAVWIALLLPLGFGELQLSTVANSESVYRFLLALLLVLGRRLPLLAGLLHGLAALCRAEHLPVALALALVILLWPRRQGWRWRCRWTRRDAALNVLGAALLLVPYSIVVGGRLAAYNEAFVGRLPQPLPEVVPVSFYGPLNFALAQREEGIFFSRRTLPPSGGDAALDPRHPMHNAYIVDGYRLGVERILDDPGRFARRSWAKLAHSLRAFVHGYTWRDLPRVPRFVRRPVDLSYAPESYVPARLYEVAIALLAAWGAVVLWRRGGRLLVSAGIVLVLYRLAINVVFFPYLRGMAIAAPFVGVLVFAGLAALAERAGERFGVRHGGRRTLAACLTVLALFHFASAWRTRDYVLRGERDAEGTILDDRTVEIELRGFL